MLDLSSVVGVILGIVAVFGGALLEGLTLGSILQFTAFLIVVGGSVGAMLFGTPQETLALSMKISKDAFLFNSNQMEEYSKTILSYAEIARRESILALEKMIAEAPHPFLQRALRCAVDGYDPDTIADVMEAEMNLAEERENNVGKMWEAVGGYTPTVGIIGAVLGLIAVMNGLARGGSTEELGHGIAVAFVATIYGVGFANLFFLPLGGKLKTRAVYNKKLKQMMLAGVLGIVHGLNPRIIEERIKCYYTK